MPHDWLLRPSRHLRDTSFLGFLPWLPSFLPSFPPSFLPPFFSSLTSFLRSFLLSFLPSFFGFLTWLPYLASFLSLFPYLPFFLLSLLTYFLFSPDLSHVFFSFLLFFSSSASNGVYPIAPTLLSLLSEYLLGDQFKILPPVLSHAFLKSGTIVNIYISAGIDIDDSLCGVCISCVSIPQILSF